jgi:hypothetical protein
MKLTHLTLLASLGMFGACATPGSVTTTADKAGYQRVDNPHFDAIAGAESTQEESTREKDRLAILGMRGDYRVDFHFEETVPLKRAYEIRDDKTTGGYETVIAVEDGEDEIVLQHLLVGPGGHVIKHWRQNWVYEAESRFEFVADQTWDVVPLAPEKTKGAWTQCVYEVSDAPRYCGTGKWNHRYGVSTWTSDRTWRPLPRREYTIRDDYNALNAENRHTVTPHGWTHEQDNTKTVRKGRDTSGTLVREFGLNDYRTIEGFDFEPAREYWAKTSDYWARVRAAWQRRFAATGTLRLTTDIDGMPIIIATFEQAEKADETSPAEQLEAIETVLDEWTESENLLSSR